jgi:hypothetical protein
LAVSLALCALVVFCDFGGMNPGKREDRGNRWIFGPFPVLSLAMAGLPAYLEGHNLWTTDEAVTPYVGLVLLTLGGTLRLAAVFVLGRRFTGLVAIQEGTTSKPLASIGTSATPATRGCCCTWQGMCWSFVAGSARCWSPVRWPS